MEEKKLTDEAVADNAITDEEVIKALRFKAEHDAKIAYIDGCAYKIIRVADVIEFIHRLQDENERLTEEKRLTIEKVKSKPIAKLTKDEILWAYQTDCGMYEARVDELQRQVTELDERFIDKQNELWDLQDDFDNLLEEGKQQAVKDTAKEIYELAKKSAYLLALNIDNEPKKDKIVRLIDLKKIVESKGVEVD